jgi:aminoglycoside 3-N-acetyltransferase
MSEQAAIHRAGEQPATIASLRDDLAWLGVAPGMVLLVHSSLSALGWVSGGSVAVLLALEAALGATGTLVMPTHSGDLSDPAAWRNPPVPEAWWPVIRDTMPAYDPELTPTRGMGAIPETFRRGRGVRGNHHRCRSLPAAGGRRHHRWARTGYGWAKGRRWPASTTWAACCCWASAQQQHLAAPGRVPPVPRQRHHQGAPVLRDRREVGQYPELDLMTRTLPPSARTEQETGLARVSKSAQ